jgi:hypothetical protein
MTGIVVTILRDLGMVSRLVTLTGGRALVARLTALGAALGVLRSQLLTQLWVGLDEVDQAAILGAISSGETQAAWLPDADRALGLRAMSHVALLTPHGSRKSSDSIMSARLSEASVA